MSARAGVASPHRLATEAGVEVLRAGGNALDAAIATNLVLGVVTPYLCGFGGDLFALVWADGAHGYLGPGRAPAAASVDEVRDAAGSDRMPETGPLTVTVPGAVEGWFSLLERFGSRSFADLARPALAVARDGFVVSEAAASAIGRASARFADETAWHAVYGAASAGEVLRQPDLARTIEALCAEGPDAYYRGAIARAIVAHLSERGAFMTSDDLASHSGRWVEPLRAPFRDATVLELPPPTQGVTALEALRIMDGFPPTGGVDRHHLMIEAVKLALGDRDAHVSDPAAMTIEAASLLDDERVDARRSLIEPGRARAMEPVRPARGGTAFMCAADARGMLVSLIQSNWMGFGSGVTVPGWGINLHNRGNYFSLDPRHVNVIGPRKLTMHTLIPALALRGGRPWLSFGTMGGDGQAQTHLQVLVGMIDDGLDPQDAIDAPRWVVSPADGSVLVEEPLAGFAEELRARGHRVRVVAARSSQMGHAHAIRVDADGYTGGSDLRAEGCFLSVVRSQAGGGP